MKIGDKTQEALRNDLLELMKKHGIRNASFAATDNNGHFHGLTSIQESQDASGLFESVLNIGRLWQHSRTIIRDVLDDFEKVWK